MNALSHPKSGFSRPDVHLRPMRSVEYEALARATQKLAGAWPRRKDQFPALAQALSENLSLWSTLAADVASSGNGLPAPLRAQIFYLFEFSTAHTAKVLDGQVGVDALIDINTALMRGLRGQGAER